MKKRKLTKKPMQLTSVRVPVEDKEAWRAVARRQRISQSEILRLALRMLLEHKSSEAASNG